MHFLASVDDGSLRRIEVTPESNAMDKSAPPPITNMLYKSTVKTSIQRMTLLTFPSPSRGDVDTVALALRDGSVSLLDAETGEQLGLIEASQTTARDLTNTANEESSFVSIECAHGLIATCTSSGLARFTKISSLWSAAGAETFEFELSAPVSVMRMHPTIPGIIAFGGKENDLQVWCSASDKRRPTDDQSDEEDDSPWETMKPLWRAKNVKNDELDLRVPVWISDLQFLTNSEEPESKRNLKILTATRFRQLRIYETLKARRPLRSIEISEHPISQIILPIPSSLDSETIFSDSVANIMHINVSKGTILGSFKGFSGAVTSITKSSDDRLLLAGGMDSYVRVFDIASHQQISSVYVGGRILQCLAIPGVPEVKLEDDDGVLDEDQEDQDVWEGLEEVADEEPQKKRSRRS